MTRGTRSLTRRLRKAAKRETAARDGLRWRGWGAPIVNRSAKPVLRFLVPVPILLFGLLLDYPQFKGTGQAMILLCIWTLVATLYLAASIQYRRIQPIWIQFHQQLPLDARAIHRMFAGPLWRHIVPFACDWLWGFGLIILLGNSWSAGMITAALAGAGVLGIVALTFAVIFAMLLNQRINFAWLGGIVLTAAILMVIYRDKLAIGITQVKVGMVEWMPFHFVVGQVLDAMDGEVSGWWIMAMEAAACLAILVILWRWSAAEFVSRLSASDAGFPIVSPPEPMAKPGSPAADDVRATLAAALARPPGSITAARGSLEKLLVAMANAETRRRLDCLTPAGLTWGMAWLVAAALITVAHLAGPVIPQEGARWLAIIALLISIGPRGGQWRLMQPFVSGTFSCPPWAALPFNLRTMGRTILLVTHFRLLLALPLVMVVTNFIFADSGSFRILAGILTCAFAAIPLGVVSQWTESVAALGPNANVNFKRIFAVLGFCLVLLALVMILFMASPPVAIAAGAVLIAIGHLTRILLTRRIDRGVYDFV